MASQESLSLVVYIRVLQGRQGLLRVPLEETEPRLHTTPVPLHSGFQLLAWLQDSGRGSKALAVTLDAQDLNPVCVTLARDSTSVNLCFFIVKNRVNKWEYIKAQRSVLVLRFIIPSKYPINTHFTI